jgi:hypothetical protein
VSVLIRTNRLAADRLELVLEEMEGAERRWWKLYDGAFFLSMDAESLGLLEPIPNPPSRGPNYRLRTSGEVRPEQLTRMRFHEAPGTHSRRD